MERLGIDGEKKRYRQTDSQRGGDKDREQS